MKKVNDMARELKVHPATLRSWAKAKLIPYHRVGKRYYFDEEEIKNSTLFKTQNDLREVKQITAKHNGISFSNGYLRIYVGEHKLSGPDGYAPLHRVIMQAALGRELTEEEIVHHKNGNTLDNRLSNLEVIKSIGEHNAQKRSMEESNEQL